MTTCSIYGCTNDALTSDPSIRYHPFPKDAGTVLDQWIQACGWHENPINLETAHICSVHFEENAYDTELNMVDQLEMVDFNVHYTKPLNSLAVPTLYLPQTLIIKENPINLEGVVLYTITPSQDDNGITTITLQESNAADKKLLQQESSSSIVTAETNEAVPQKEKLETKYCHVKSYLDLYVLQAHNKSLKRKIELAEKEVAELERTFSEKNETLYDVEEKCQELETRIANRNMYTQQEQKTILSKVFSESQIKILLGKKKVSWSDDDMAVGYTLRHLSNKRFYAYLTKSLNIPLPAVSSIKRWITTKKGKKSEAKKGRKSSSATK